MSAGRVDTLLSLGGDLYMLTQIRKHGFKVTHNNCGKLCEEFGANVAEDLWGLVAFRID